MDKREEFTISLKEFMRAKDEIGVATVRLIIAALKDRDISVRGTGKAEGISEAEILSMLQGMVRQRQESSKVYRDAGRSDLSDREDAEIKVIERFLPRQMGDEEMGQAIAKAISEIGAKDIKDMGKVMAAIKTQYAGQMDMARAGIVVKEKLSAA